MSWNDGCSGLSARERNKLKRKSRALHRSGSAEGSSKRSRTGNDAADAATEQAEAEEDNQEWLAVAAGQWPFQGICDQMCLDVLDPLWEVSRPLSVCFKQKQPLYSAHQHKVDACHQDMFSNL